MKTYIKNSNVTAIDNHIKGCNNSIKGSKLFALLKLVNLKGSKVSAKDNEYLNGVKVIEYKKGFYIGFKKTTFKGGYFKLNTITLKNI